MSSQIKTLNVPVPGVDLLCTLVISAGSKRKMTFAIRDDIRMNLAKSGAQVR